MVTGALIEIDGVDCYRIDGVEEMEPFLMSVVSSSDLWMFASSRGTLTAGRRNADHALLPYETDDRIHRAPGVTGPITLIARTVGGRREVWHPFGAQVTPGVRRSVAKSLLSDRVIFEETNPEWGLSFRTTWMPSPSWGWVRRVELTNLGDSDADLEVLDGLLDIMPAGVQEIVEQIRSNLVDAYKRSEKGPWNTAAVYSLESLVSDKAEPGESLAATVIWSHGDVAEVHLDERVVHATLEGREWPAPNLLLGRRGAYLLRGRPDVPAGGNASWSLVADVGLNHADVVERTWLAGAPDAPTVVARDVAAGSTRLNQLLAGADGFQHTGDPIADAHHLSNVLYNTMRGGLLPHGHQIPIPDLVEHLRRWNLAVYRRHAPLFHSLGELAGVDAVRALAADTADPDLIRLVFEYIPLAFSRRHGDPSRPWNRFSIEVKGPSGEEAFGYEGNWRDIFQNWEALLLSHPAFLPHAVAKFVNASTFDGHNPYRITHNGVDWEVPDPHDPWSNIGYWGDHQIVYLHRLLEMWERFAPGEAASWLDRPVFVYADVPYTIADRTAMVADPRNTISFDEEHAAIIDDRVGRIGSDGRLVAGGSGEIIRVGLLEKLLVPLLAKLTNFVPGGGIWMNTQRPEWNDANNALAGYGLSMVTLYHVYGFVTALPGILEARAERAIKLTPPVARWLEAVTAVLERFVGDDCHVDDQRRRQLMDELGSVGDDYRSAFRSDASGAAVSVDLEAVERLCTVAATHLECSIDGARRSDELFESYNLVAFPSSEEARVERLGPMLEGQVAVLSSGVLDAKASLSVIEALYGSGMYRSDQASFMLYPMRELPSYLDRNVLSPEERRLDTLLDELAGSAGVLLRDRDGGLHFAPEMSNATALATALEVTSLSAAERAVVADVYEDVFRHHRFTGRSGSMYSYEGIGSIYWHMVGKLLLAVQETYWAAVDGGEPDDVTIALVHMYRKIRAGLGFCKSPADYGAIPTDCYSHTPMHAGAQQPGMTGQVKEEILTRFGELGLRVGQGCISVQPGLLQPEKTVPSDGEPGTAEFHYCGIPFMVEFGEQDSIEIQRAGHWAPLLAGATLPPDVSREVFMRAGSVDAVKLTITAP